MAEERTVSAITAINTSRRNRQRLDTIVNQTQVRQYYAFDPEKHAQQKRNAPTPRFSALKKYRTPRYVNDSSSESEEDDGGDDEDVSVAANSMTASTEVPILSSDFRQAVKQILGDINPDSAALAGRLDSNGPSHAVSPAQAPAALSVSSTEHVLTASLVKDDDKYPQL